VASVRSGSLTVVGSGIKAGLQTTPEAKRWIEQTDKVLYLFADPVPATWVSKLNPSAQSLQGFYSPSKDRRETYEEIVEEIMSWVRRRLDVCVVFYGHPGVFVAPSHEAIRRARREGFPARMLPGVSAEDCLFADLGVDPGTWGCQSFEATIFLLYRRNVDITTPLLLWQVGVVGVRHGVTQPSTAGLQVLAEFLQKHYGPDHEVILHEASPYPVFEPIVQRMRLRDLPTASLTPMCTLYVPPKGPPPPNAEMHSLLKVPLLAPAESIDDSPPDPSDPHRGGRSPL
jgi:precorrin-6B methylase 1